MTCNRAKLPHTPVLRNRDSSPPAAGVERSFSQEKLSFINQDTVLRYRNNSCFANTLASSDPRSVPGDDMNY